MFGWTHIPRPLTPARRQRLTRDVEDELEFHLSMREEDNRREGMDATDARMDARQRFGDVERIAAACVRAEEDHPIRTARRMLASALTLAVGFGAIALAFGLAYTAMLKPLRFTDADQLVRVGEGWDDALVPTEEFEVWRDKSTSFEHLVTFNATTHTLTGSGAPLHARAMVIGDGFFDAFDVRPQLGRLFETYDAKEGATDATLISEELWNSRYNRSRSVLGATIELDGQPRTIIGVMPTEAQLTHKVDLWTPLEFHSGLKAQQNYVVGRLSDGVTLTDARREMLVLADELEAADPNAAATRTPFYPLQDLYIAPVRSTLQLLLLAAALVLILVWAVTFRVALARAEERRDLLEDGDLSSTFSWFENLGVTLVGAALGLAFALVVRSTLYTALFGRWGTVFDDQTDGVVIAAVLVIAGLTVVALRLIPRLVPERTGPRMYLRRGLQRGLSVSVVAIAVVLLVAFGQRAKPVLDAHRTSLGFDEGRVFSASLPLPNNMDESAAEAVHMSIVSEIRSVPIVEAVSFARAFPLHESRHRLITLPIQIERARDVIKETQEWQINLVGPEYFQTMGIPILTGRGIAHGEVTDDSTIAVVNEAFARNQWPAESPIGRRIRIGPEEHYRAVIGVVGDVHYFGGTGEARATVYVPHTQAPPSSSILIVRSSASLDQLHASIRDAASRVAPDIAFEETTAVSTLRSEAWRSERANLWILGLMALASLTCAVTATIRLISDDIWNRLAAIEHEQAHRRHTSAVLLSAWRPALMTVSAGVMLGLVLASVFTQNVWPNLFGEVDGGLLLAAAALTGLLILLISLISARQVLAIEPARKA